MMRTTVAIVFVGVSGCAVSGTESETSTAGDSFESFVERTYREPWDGGHFIVDGDTPIPDEKQLFEFWGGLQQGALIVNTVGGNDDKWNDQRKLNLTYCVSNNFGTHKADVVAALASATDQGWESM